MNTSLFRKSSIDRVNSPEQLNEYINVANPGIWIILATIIALLLGFVIWGIFGTVETNVNTGVVVVSDVATCYVGEEDAAKLAQGMKVTVNGTEGSIKSVSSVPVKLDETFDNTLLYFAGLTTGDYGYEVQIEISGLNDGVFKADITVDSVNPMKFVIS